MGRILNGLLAAAGIGLTLCGPLAAQDQDPRTAYQECLTLAVERPRQGFERAGQWGDFGGGAAARHCRAVALLHLGELEAAAEELEALPQESRLAAPLAASILHQAAAVRLDLRQVERALELLTLALEITPGDPNLLEDRAVVLTDLDRVAEAVEDLSQALARDPQRLSALVLRGAAYRRLGAFDQSLADLHRAMGIDALDPHVWLERGNLFRVQGDAEAARQDWMTVLRLTREGPLAEAAQANLESLDVRRE